MVFVPLQVGASLGFKGTGKGSHSKIRKKGENANKALKRLGPAKGIRPRITFHACLCMKALTGRGKVSTQPILQFCLVSSCRKRWRRQDVQSNLQTRNLQNASWLGVSGIIHVQKRAEYEYRQVYFAGNVIVKGLTEDESCRGSTQKITMIICMLFI